MQETNNVEGVIVPLPGEREYARQSPGGYLYRIAGAFASHEHIPPQAVVGGWQVDENGEIVGEFIVNPSYDPALYPPPADAG